jgi:2-octaprenyl-6-methoxyphenol hydroxylase
LTKPVASKSVIVAGAGAAGLAAACLLALDGIAVKVLAPPPQPDLRTVALMQPAMKLLRFLDVWTADLENLSAALRQLHIVDDTGHYLSAPRLEFMASEIGADAFGWNIPLADLLPALRARAEILGVDFSDDRVKHASVRGDEIVVETEGGALHSARVAVAADGKDSKLRELLKTDVLSHDWKQTALVTNFAHSIGHDGISTEYHRPNGLMTTVPQPGNRSSLVWMDLPHVIAGLAALAPEKLATEIQLASHGNLGRVFDVSAVQSFRMMSRRANRMAGSRVFLVGEAAHSFPPIGAQGLNLSLRDAGHAADIISNADDPGSAANCDAYHVARQADVVSRSGAISAMNFSLLADSAPLAAVRSAGLALVNSVPQLRRRVVQYGLAPAGNLPFAMR